jgi:hypothetical protein
VYCYCDLKLPVCQANNRTNPFYLYSPYPSDSGCGAMGIFILSPLSVGPQNHEYSEAALAAIP